MFVSCKVLLASVQGPAAVALCMAQHVSDTAAPTDNIRSVFVYGSLKPGEHNAYVATQAGSFSSRPAYIEGMALYHLEPENYPAMIPGNDRVYGCVLDYEDMAAALPALDALEGCDLQPPLYHRRVVWVQPMHEQVWVYIYAQSQRLEQEGVRYLPQGRWPA